MHENNRCLTDNDSPMHTRNGYPSDEVLQPLFKSTEPSSNNNDPSDSPPMDSDQLQNVKNDSLENLPNENCSTICDIVPVSSLDASNIGHHQQLSASTSVLASTSNLDEMSATFEAAQQRYWMSNPGAAAFSHHNYNQLLFTQPDWISNYSHQQPSILQHSQLQQQQVNESLMSAGQMGNCASSNPHFASFYDITTTDSTHNPMLFIQPHNIQSVSPFKPRKKSLI